MKEKLGKVNGCKVIARKKYNPTCKADDFLNVVLVEGWNNVTPFVVW